MDISFSLKALRYSVDSQQWSKLQTKKNRQFVMPVFIYLFWMILLFNRRQIEFDQVDHSRTENDIFYSYNFTTSYYYYKRFSDRKYKFVSLPLTNVFYISIDWYEINFSSAVTINKILYIVINLSSHRIQAICNYVIH